MRVTPVANIDGRVIGVENHVGVRGPVTARLQQLYETLPDRGPEWATELPPFNK